MVNSLLVGEYNLIAHDLASKLLEGGSCVYVVAQRLEDWQTLLFPKVFDGKFFVSKGLPTEITFNYVFAFANYGVVEDARLSPGVKIAVLKSIYTEPGKESVLSGEKFKNTIYFNLGEILGETNPQGKNFPANTLLCETVRLVKPVRFEDATELYISPSRDTTRYILQHFFSLNKGGEKYSFYNTIDAKLFGTILGQYFGYSLGGIVSIKNPLPFTAEVQSSLTEVDRESLLGDLQRLNIDIKKQEIEIPAKLTGNTPKKAANNKKQKSKKFHVTFKVKSSLLVSLVSLLFWFFVLPFSPQTVGKYLYLVSAYLLKNNQVGIAQKTSLLGFELADYSFRRLQKNAQSYKALSVFYNRELANSYITKVLAESQVLTISLIQNYESVVKSVLVDKSESPEAVFDSVYLDADKLFRNQAAMGVDNIFLRRNLLVRQFGLRAQDLLARRGEGAYLILFQDSRRPRPSGGVIYAIGLVNLKAGKLTNVSISSVESFDKQLKGIVTAQQDFQIFSIGKQWTMQDVNWSSDFNVVAEAAQWFLERQIGEKVIGVIALDQDILNNLGKLVGAEQFVDSFDENQLVEWTKEVTSKLTNIPPANYLPMGRLLAQGLEEKHILLYSNLSALRNSLNSAGFGGSIQNQKCDCDINQYAVLESWVRGPKIEVERTQSLDTQVTAKNVINNLNYWLKSNDGGNSRVQVRLVVPVESEVVKIVVKKENISEEALGNTLVYSNRKEVSIVLDEVGDKGVLVNFVWQIPKKEKVDRYQIAIAKQSGMKPMPVSIKTTISLSSLTNTPVFFYNTDLGVDFLLTITY
ncbi:MAG: hypothetical protein ACD_52C00052G0005 [uncultured bacterium]|nr:MAG: hypothetical protein ACD_52C00052G0005 [uncultured bacterium]